MAPYAIAHLKIGLKLYETGYRFGSDERARIYLTNALEPAHDFSGRFEFAHSGARARGARRSTRSSEHRRFTVVIGNPPYAGHSANASRDELGQRNFIGGLVNDYYAMNGVPLGERNSKWLQDDYVKFLRFGQYLLSETGVGVLGYITNNGYLDNPTFRGMRLNLIQSFAAMNILDIHGNTKKREFSSDGSKDENVFDIQQGVAIGVFVRSGFSGRTGDVCHRDLYGTREQKYDALSSSLVRFDGSEILTPNEPYYLFVPQDQESRQVYEEGWKITDIMPLNNTVVKSSIMEYGVDEARVVTALYRPFDLRWTYYTPKSRGFIAWPVNDVMQHMLSGRNLALVCSRQQSVQGPWSLVGVADSIIESSYISNKTAEINSLFPLYRYPTEEEAAIGIGADPNLNPAFVDALCGATGLSFTSRDTQEQASSRQSFTAHDVLHYIYGVLHSAAYRARYREFLKIDFPRIPLPSSSELLGRIATLGRELVALHLMKARRPDQSVSNYVGPRHPEVGRVGWANDAVWLDAPAPRKGRPSERGTVGFHGVPETVWTFRIGAYQVCHKWLKDRKGRRLSDTDVAHYQKILAAIAETIALMQEIDDVIDRHGGWPAAFVTSTVDRATEPLATP